MIISEWLITCHRIWTSGEILSGYGYALYAKIRNLECHSYSKILVIFVFPPLQSAFGEPAVRRMEDGRVRTQYEAKWRR
jgi:hypothetical protein